MVDQYSFVMCDGIDVEFRGLAGAGAHPVVDAVHLTS